MVYHMHQCIFLFLTKQFSYHRWEVTRFWRVKPILIVIKPERPQQSSYHSISATHFPFSCGYYLNLIFLPLHLRSKQGSQQKNLVMDLVSAAKFKFAGEQKCSLPPFPFEKAVIHKLLLPHNLILTLIGWILHNWGKAMSDTVINVTYFPIYLRGIGVVTHRSKRKAMGDVKNVGGFFCLLTSWW